MKEFNCMIIALAISNKKSISTVNYKTTVKTLPL